jgi:hypothetical protein
MMSKVILETFTIFVFQLVEVVTNKKEGMEWLGKEGGECRFSWYTVGTFMEKTYNEMSERPT